MGSMRPYLKKKNQERKPRPKPGCRDLWRRVGWTQYAIGVTDLQTWGKGGDLLDVQYIAIGTFKNKNRLKKILENKLTKRHQQYQQAQRPAEINWCVDRGNTVLSKTEEFRAGGMAQQAQRCLQPSLTP